MTIKEFETIGVIFGIGAIFLPTIYLGFYLKKNWDEESKKKEKYLAIAGIIGFIYCLLFIFYDYIFVR